MFIKKLILLAISQDTTSNLRTEVNQFALVVLFLITYFSIATTLYLAQIGIEFINYWKFLSSLSLWLFGVAIATYALGNAFYQSIPSLLVLITLISISYYLRKKEKTITTLLIFVLSSCLLILYSLLAIIRSIVNTGYIFPLANVIGLGDRSQTIGFLQIYNLLFLAYAHFRLEDWFLLLIFLVIILISSSAFFHARYASYTFLQERPSPAPYAGVAIGTIIVLISFLIDAIPILLFCYFVGSILSIYISFINYKNSKSNSYIMFMSMKSIFLIALIISVFFIPDLQNICVACNLILLISDLFYIPKNLK